jgi:pectinesterase
VRRIIPAKAASCFLPVAVLAIGLSGCAGAWNDRMPVYRVEHDCAKAADCYTSVQAALDAAQKAGGAQWVAVDIGAGDFNEKVTLRRPKTVLRGRGAGQTRLYYDAVAETAGRFHRNGWGTPGSATLTIDADEVTVEGLTIENTFDYLHNDALPDGDPRKIGNSQGLAVLLDIHSDKVLVSEAALLGYQDTLFANGARAYIRRSLIAGNIDFIFGNGQVLIEDSEIRTRNRGVAIPAGEFHSFIAAPSTPLSQRMGIVVYRSRLTREAGVPDNSVALGRPWHPTTRFADGRYADPNAVGQASFIDCFMDAHIHHDHWTSMNGTARDGTKTAVFRPQDSRFSESGSTGPGALHADIGITWADPIAVREVQASMFRTWPLAKR